MTDIERLIEAVEAGRDDDVLSIQRGMCSIAYDKGETWPSNDATKAYWGSFDAALALRNTLFPGARWELFGPRSDGTYGCNLPRLGIDTQFAANPGRAMLLAILRAKAAQE